jgi:hypothetical protein
VASPTPLSEKTLLVCVHAEKQVWIGCPQNIGTLVESPDYGILVGTLRGQTVGSPVIRVDLLLVARTACVISDEASARTRVLCGRLNRLERNSLWHRLLRLDPTLCKTDKGQKKPDISCRHPSNLGTFVQMRGAIEFVVIFETTSLAFVARA